MNPRSYQHAAVPFPPGIVAPHPTVSPRSPLDRILNAMKMLKSTIVWYSHGAHYNRTSPAAENTMSPIMDASSACFSGTAVLRAGEGALMMVSVKLSVSAFLVSGLFITRPSQRTGMLRVIVPVPGVDSSTTLAVCATTRWCAAAAAVRLAADRNMSRSLIFADFPICVSKVELRLEVASGTPMVRQWVLGPCEACVQALIIKRIW